MRNRIAAGQLPFHPPASRCRGRRLRPRLLGCNRSRDRRARCGLGWRGCLHQFGHGRLAVFLYFGLAFGIVFQRSRFCLVNAFREPFLSGDSEHARAAALALVMAMIGFTILKATDLKDASEWVFPSFWLGALVGGVLFGIGMVLAGGCGAGSIWRVGEGHVKLWVAVFFFAVSASVMRQLLVRSDLIRRLGDGIFLPDAFWLDRRGLGSGRTDDYLVFARRMERREETSGHSPILNSLDGSS